VGVRRVWLEPQAVFCGLACMGKGIMRNAELYPYPACIAKVLKDLGWVFLVLFRKRLILVSLTRVSHVLNLSNCVYFAIGMSAHLEHYEN
jgi:hypothetical protein